MYLGTKKYKGKKGNGKARWSKTLVSNPNKRSHRDHRSKKNRKSYTDKGASMDYKKRQEELHIEAIEDLPPEL